MMAHAVLALLAVSARPKPLDSQLVLRRYTARLLSLKEPKTLVFSYAVSQAGPHDIEQTHRVYRSGALVRDEILTVDGQSPKPPITRIERYRNRYTVAALAPRETQYAFLFERDVRIGHHLAYVFRTVPLGATGGFVIDRVTIDGLTFLPSVLAFSTQNATARGKGTATFAKAGPYWVATAVSVQAKLDGKPARERIAFHAYQFPTSLPKSTFKSPKPLPALKLPTF